MLSLSGLWLPVVVSAVGVFITSAVVHMVLPFHKGDYQQLPKEDSVRSALRDAGPAPGQYMTPYCSNMKDLGTPEMIKKFEEGPVGTFSIQANGMIKMGKSLALWFVLCLIISDFCAYIAGLSLGDGAEYLAVFQIVGATAFMAYALGEPANSIWRFQTWGNTLRSMIDGLLYALVTAGVFGWLWPAA